MTTAFDMSHAIVEAIRRMDMFDFPEWIASLDGYTGLKQRYFLNTLMKFRHWNYLEVGVFKGASLLSAAAGNEGYFHGIDNFVEGTLSEACANITKLDQANVKLTVENVLEVNGFNRQSHVVFYDANTDEQACYRGMWHLKTLGAICDPFILITDNWSYESSRAQYHTLLHDMNWHAFAEFVLMSDKDSDIDGWWNGWCVSVISRSELRTTYISDFVKVHPDLPKLCEIQKRRAAGLLTIQDYRSI